MPSTIGAPISFFVPDRTYGFEEFRRDVEDAREWTPVQYYSASEFGTAAAAYEAAERSIPWLAEILARAPHLRKMA